MIDCSDENCLSAYKTLCSELEGFSRDLLGKPHIVLCNKIDIEGAGENAEKIAAEIKKTEPDTKVIPLSVVAHMGLNDVRIAILELVGNMTSWKEKKTEAKVKTSSFMDSRSVDEFMEEQFPGQDNSEQ